MMSAGRRNAPRYKGQQPPSAMTIFNPQTSSGRFDDSLSQQSFLLKMRGHGPVIGSQRRMRQDHDADAKEKTEASRRFGL